MRILHGINWRLRKWSTISGEIKMRVLEIVRAALGAIYLHGAIINLQFALLDPRGSTGEGHSRGS